MWSKLMPRILPSVAGFCCGGSRAEGGTTGSGGGGTCGLGVRIWLAKLVSFDALAPFAGGAGGGWEQTG